MAGFIAERNEVGVRRYGESCTVPPNATAKLMYYFDSVASVLEIDNYNANRLKNYNKYYLLDDEDIDTLLTLVCLFSPDELIGKVFFPDEDLEGSINHFYELSSVTHLVAVADSVLIGGQRRRVAKVMFFKQTWMQTYFFQPMRAYQSRLNRLAMGLPGRSPSPTYSIDSVKSSACIIL